MEYSNIIERLKLIKSKMRFAKGKEKQLLAEDFFFLCDYLDSAKQSHNVTIDSIYEEKLNDKVFKTINNVAWQYCDNLSIITPIYNELLNQFEKTPVISINSNDYFKFNEKEMLDILYDFFNKVDPFLYSIFKNMIKNNYISIVEEFNDTYAGFSIPSTFTGHSSVIILKKTNDFTFWETLVHEMGHIYQFNITKTTNHNKLSPFCEVPSYFLENIFHYYCHQNPYLNKMINREIIKNMLYIYDSVENANTINLLASEGYDIIYDSDTDTYSFSDNDLLDTTNCFSANPVNPNDYQYPLSNIIANNFAKLYRESPTDGLKTLKSFLTTLNQYSFSENLLKYGTSLDETKRIIKFASEEQRKTYHL